MGQVLLACGNTVLVDDEDESLVTSRGWRLVPRGNHKRPYVIAGTTVGGVRREIFLHREIIGAGPGEIVDHISGDPLDNRRSNLRFASHTENMRNRSAHEIQGKHSVFKGVSRFVGGKWRALIRDGKAQKYLGTFTSETAAAFAYDMASLRLHGEFGRRNFLPFC